MVKAIFDETSTCKVEITRWKDNCMGLVINVCHKSNYKPGSGNQLCIWLISNRPRSPNSFVTRSSSQFTGSYGLSSGSEICPWFWSRRTCSGRTLLSCDTHRFALRPKMNLFRIARRKLSVSRPETLNEARCCSTASAL